QSAPVPEPDVLQRGPVGRRIDGVDARLCWERPLLDAVEPVGHARQLDVVFDVILLADQLVRLHDEAGHVPTEGADDEVAGCGGYGRGDQPADLRLDDAVDPGDDGSHHERYRDQHQPGKYQVIVGVVDSRENRVIVQQMLESSDVHA